MLGLRLAARNIFYCSLEDLRTVLPPECEHMYNFKGVMAYLASRKRSELQLSSSTAVLQVVTLDELQLVTGQIKGLRCHSPAIPNIMINALASWMISGSPGVSDI